MGSEKTKYITYPQTKALSSSEASYDKTTGVVTFHIPLSDVGNPAKRNRPVQRHGVQRHLRVAPVPDDAVQPDTGCSRGQPGAKAPARANAADATRKHHLNEKITRIRRAAR